MRNRELERGLFYRGDRNNRSIVRERDREKKGTLGYISSRIVKFDDWYCYNIFSETTRVLISDVACSRMTAARDVAFNMYSGSAGRRDTPRNSKIVRPRYRGSDRNFNFTRSVFRECRVFEDAALTNAKYKRKT